MYICIYVYVYYTHTHTHTHTHTRTHTCDVYLAAGLERVNHVHVSRPSEDHGLARDKEHACDVGAKFLINIYVCVYMYTLYHIILYYNVI